MFLSEVAISLGRFLSNPLAGRARRSLWRAENAIATAAKKLGLRSSGGSLSGDLGVHVHAIFEETSPEDPELRLRVTARFASPLELGLALYTPVAADDPVGRQSTRVVLRGELAQKIAVFARERFVAAHLFELDGAKSLIAALDAGYAASIDDAQVVLFRDPGFIQSSVVVAAVHRAAAIAHDLTETRSSLWKNDRAAAMADIWPKLVESYGGRIDRIRKELIVERAAGKLHVSCELENEQYWTTRCELGFARALPVELAVTIAEAHSTWDRLTGQDLLVNETEFDTAFIVRGPSESSVRALLSTEVRKTLVSLRDSADEIELTRARLVVKIHRMLHAIRLESIVSAMLAVGEALDSSGPRHTGAYR